jgi:hypothetical protein
VHPFGTSNPWQRVWRSPIWMRQRGY